MNRDVRACRTLLAAAFLTCAAALPAAAQGAGRGAGSGVDALPPLPPSSLRPETPGGPPFGVGVQSLASSTSPGPALARPGLALLPQDDDWSFLADPARRTRPFDALRYVPLDADGDWVLSTGAYLYTEYELFDDANWGDAPGTDGYVNTRANVYGGVTWNERVRLFAGLKHGGRYDDRGPTAPTEADDIDLHMGILEVALGDLVGGSKKDLLVRAGRMELHYGDGRMISMRQGPNVRRDNDGVLVRYRRGRAVVDAFAAYRVEDDGGAFDNATVTNEGLWGVYGTTPFAGGNLDLYYIGQRQADAPFIQGLYAEKRQSLGARYWTGPQGFRGGPWLIDAEGTIQFGDADLRGPGLEGQSHDADIKAWAAAAHVGYAFEDAAWSPVLTLTTGITSGHGDADDDDIGTFEAPAPPGKYFGETNPLGPGNLTGVTATLGLSPTPKLSVAPALLAFWRLEDEDGIYTPGPSVPLRGAEGESNFLGWEGNLTAAYPLTDTLTLSGEVAYFDVSGDYLPENGPAEDIFRTKVVIAFRF